MRIKPADLYQFTKSLSGCCVTSSGESHSVERASSVPNRLHTKPWSSVDADHGSSEKSRPSACCHGQAAEPCTQTQTLGSYFWRWVYPYFNTCIICEPQHIWKYIPSGRRGPNVFPREEGYCWWTDVSTTWHSRETNYQGLSRSVI